MAYQSPEQLRRERLQKWGTGPTRKVRPMLPSSYDARESWRENAGGKMIGIDQYKENNRKMYTMEDVPTPAPAPTSRWQAPGIGGAMAIAGRYGGLDRPSTEADAFAPTATQQTAAQYTENDMRGNYPRTAAAPRPAMPLWGPSTEADAFADPRAPSVMPSAWQTKSLKPMIGAAERWGTALNDRPGGGRNFENLSRPMGQGSLDQRPNRQDSEQQTKDYYARKDARNARSRGYVESGKRGTNRFSAYGPPEPTD